jgi:hypothetical protein
MDLEKQPEEERSAKDMPIFKHVKQYIQNETDNKRFATTTKKEMKSPTTSPFKYGQRPNLIETAASASTVATDATFYGTEVPKSMNVKCTDVQGKTHSYVAMKSPHDICPKCYETNGTKKSTSECPRPCFAFQCRTCEYYGHKSAMCKQSHTVDGNAIKK